MSNMGFIYISVQVQRMYEQFPITHFLGKFRQVIYSCCSMSVIPAFYVPFND